MRIAFVVPGNPRPADRPRAHVTKSGKQIMFKVGKSREYEQLVALLAKKAFRAQGIRTALDGPVRLGACFYRADARRCDIDNLLKSVLDGLTKARAWRDDSQVVEVVISKRLSRTSPRAEVWVERAELANLSLWSEPSVPEPEAAA